MVEEIIGIFGNSRSRLLMWSMSYFPAHIADTKIPHCPPRSKKMVANPPRAYCKTKITICPTQCLPSLFCFGLTHAPVSNWDLHDLTKEKTAYAIFSFVAHPPPNNEKAFANNKEIFGNLEKSMLQFRNEIDIGTNRRLTSILAQWRHYPRLKEQCKKNVCRPPASTWMPPLPQYANTLVAILGQCRQQVEITN